MSADLTSIAGDVHDVADLLHQPLAPVITERDIRNALEVLIDAADAAVFAAIEDGDLPATHHAMACGKELAVIAICLAHAVAQP